MQKLLRIWLPERWGYDKLRQVAFDPSRTFAVAKAHVAPGSPEFRLVFSEIYKMDVGIASKLVFGVISSLGTMALIFYNMGQARKVKAELLEKFEEAINMESKHSATELFRLIHGLRMNYSDVVELIKNDDCSKIIYALKKTPGIVSFKNGEFRYAGVGRNKLFRYLDRWFTRFSIFLFGGFLLLSLAVMVMSEGSSSVAGFLFMIFSSAILTFQLRQRIYDQMIDSLVSPEHKKEDPAGG